MVRMTPLKRFVFFLLADSLLIAFSLYASFWLRFDGSIPAEYAKKFPAYLGLALIIKISFLAAFGMYKISWRFFGLGDLQKLIAAVSMASASLVAVYLGFRARGPFSGFPRAVMLADYVITLGVLGLLRISKRAVIEYLSKAGRMRHGRTRILIVGAGEAGSAIGRDMLINKKSKYFPVGYIDDDLSKRGMSIHGIKVLGTRNDIPTLLKANAIDEVLIAIPSARSKDIRHIVEIIRDSGGPAKVKILPGILDLMDGNVTLSDIKEVRVEDLWEGESRYRFRRDPRLPEPEVRLDHGGRRVHRGRARPDGAPVRAALDHPPRD